jgi:hypothetical protein
MTVVGKEPVAAGAGLCPCAGSLPPDGIEPAKEGVHGGTMGSPVLGGESL